MQKGVFYIKKIILIILVLSLFCSLIACTPKPTTSSEESNLQWCMEQGYFEGIPEEYLYIEDNLNGEASVTPETLSVMLANLSTNLGFNLNGYLKDYEAFADSEQGLWYSEAVHWIYIYEIVKRTDNLGVGIPMTKEYFAALCYNYLNLYYEFDEGAPSVTQAEFGDSDSIENYKSELAKMAFLDLLIYDENNNFNPTQNITLAQACELFRKLSDYCNEQMTLKKTFRHGIACDFRIVGYYDMSINFGEVEYDSAEFYQEIWDVGFDHIRLVINFSSENPYPEYNMDHVAFDEEGNPHVTEEFYEVLDLITKLATDAGLYVVLDMHESEIGVDRTTSEGHQQNLAYFNALWSDIAEHYKDASEKIFFELMNEPNFNADDPDWVYQILRDYMQSGVNTIREIDEDRMIITTFESASYQLCAKNHPEMIEQFKQDPYIWFTCHNYFPYEFTIENNRTHIDAVTGEPIYYPFNEDMERITISEIQAIRETEIELGIDFWVGEFGAFDNVNHEDRIAYYKASAKTYRRCQIAWCKWEISWGFTTYDLWTKEWDQEMLDALFS